MHQCNRAIGNQSAAQEEPEAEHRKVRAATQDEDTAVDEIQQIESTSNSALSIERIAESRKNCIGSRGVEHGLECGWLASSSWPNSRIVAHEVLNWQSELDSSCRSTASRTSSAGVARRVLSRLCEQDEEGGPMPGTMDNVKQEGAKSLLK